MIEQQTIKEYAAKQYEGLTAETFDHSLVAHLFHL